MYKSRDSDRKASSKEKFADRVAADYCWCQDGKLLRRWLLQRAEAVVQVERQHLKVIIGGEVRKEVALDLHDPIELITLAVGLATTQSAWA